MNTQFILAESWHGGFYELSIEMKTKDDASLDLAIRSCWSRPEIHGCYTSRTIEMADQDIKRPSLDLLNEYGHVFGTAKLQDGSVVPCGMVIIREESGPDFVDMYFPLGGLLLAYPEIGGYPFGDNDNCRNWREPIDELFTDIGRHVFGVVPFNLGSIGFEVSGNLYSNDMNRIMSEERYNRYLVPSDKGVKILYPTIWA